MNPMCIVVKRCVPVCKVRFTMHTRISSMHCESTALHKAWLVAWSLVQQDLLVAAVYQTPNAVIMLELSHIAWLRV